MALMVVAMLCATAIAFYLRFLMALTRECKHRWTGHRVPLHPRDGPYLIQESSAPERAIRRAV